MTTTRFYPVLGVLVVFWDCLPAAAATSTEGPTTSSTEREKKEFPDAFFFLFLVDSLPRHSFPRLWLLSYLISSHYLRIL